MKIFAKMWWVFSITSLIITVMNPCMGVFGVLNLIETLFLSIVSINFYFNIKKMYKSNNGYISDKLTEIHFKSVKILAYFGSVFFLIFKTAANTLMFLAAYMEKDYSLSFINWNSPEQISFICFGLSIIFNILTMISFIQKARLISKGKYYNENKMMK